MSDDKKPVLSAETEDIGLRAVWTKVIVPKIIGPLVRRLLKLLDSVIVRDTIKFFGWIASILIIAGLCWTLTQPVRNRFLIRAVNRVFEQYGDFRRVAELSFPEKGSSLIGSWHTVIKARQPGIPSNDDLPEGTKAFIFSFVAEGTFFPCAAIIDPMGKVQEFIPLNGHGKKILARISPGILKLYTRRIEGAE